MKKHRKPLNRSITIGCIIFIFSLCILLSLANVALYKNYVYNDYRGYIADLLNYTLSQIDGDDLRGCIETGQESEKFKETLLFMDDLMEHFDDVHYFYAVLPLNTEETGNMMSVLSAERYYDRYVDTEGNLYLGWISEDEFDAATAAQFFDILNGNDIIYFEEKTEWGLDYTGAVAIRDSKGEGVAVLAVDIDISFINSMILQYAAMNIIIISSVGVMFIVIFLLWSRRNITRPIRLLERSAVGFADRSSGQRNLEVLSFEPPELLTDNEIKSLSDAVVKMTEDMRAYVNGIIIAEKQVANMWALANQDALTGVRNKTAYLRELQRVEAKIAVGLTKVGLGVVDLNFLKKLNDTYGHDKGDIAIRNLCHLVCRIFEHSPVFRVGGDEFVIIIAGRDFEHCDALVAEFNGELERLANDESLKPWDRISAAMGIAFYDSNLDECLDDLFKRADRIMYDRKREMKAERGA
ncbi:MAG: GGDEF domain-containing protein [bacterium]